MPYYIVTSRNKVDDDNPFKSLHQAKCNCKTRWGKAFAKRVKHIIYKDGYTVRKNNGLPMERLNDNKD